MTKPTSKRSQRRLSYRLKRRSFHRDDASPRLRNHHVTVHLLQDPAEAAATDGQGPTVDQLKERLIRLQAEFENFRKRTRRETVEIKETASSGLIAKILPILDNFHRALEAPAAEMESFLQGIKMIESQLMNQLSEEGLEPIEAAGTAFNPEIHEAVMVDPNEELEENQVVEVLQAGYRMKGKLIRPAMVKVSRSS